MSLQSELWDQRQMTVRSIKPWWLPWWLIGEFAEMVYKFAVVDAQDSLTINQAEHPRYNGLPCPRCGRIKPRNMTGFCLKCLNEVVAPRKI